VSLRVIIAVTALSGVLIAVPAQADTKDDLDAAREELASKQAELDAITLQWQQTETAYAQAQDAVNDAQEQIGTLQAQLVKIQRKFDKQVRSVYISGGSEAIGALLAGIAPPLCLGTLTLGGNNTYAGSTTINGGPVAPRTSSSRLYSAASSISATTS